MIDKYVPSISSFASDIDGLILVVLAIVGFWFLLAEFVFFGLILKFKEEPGRKAQYVSGEKPEEKRWISIPHYATLVFDVLIVVMAVKVWHTVKIDRPGKLEANSEGKQVMMANGQQMEKVRIIAQQWAWTFVHPGKDGVLGSDDDIHTVDELHVEAGKVDASGKEQPRVYEFELTSRDVLHSFSVPVFRLKQDAIPGRVINGWFDVRPGMTGQYDIQCTEICGIGHGIMPARIIIETPEQHAAWIETAPKLRSQQPALITGFEEPKDDGKVGAIAPAAPADSAIARTDINTKGELAP